jgi:hypothetical protein
MPDVLNLLRILVRPNGEVLLVGLDCILRATELFFRQGLAEPAGRHLRVKSQSLVVALDGFFQTPQGAETARLVVPGSGALRVEIYGLVEAGDGTFPMPKVGKQPGLVLPAGCILGRGSGRESPQVGIG